MNKSQIISEICEGRFFAENECQGKCFIKKQADDSANEIVVHFENELTHFFEATDDFLMSKYSAELDQDTSDSFYKNIYLEVDTPPPRLS